MTKQKFLSRKKTAQQSISIPSSLREEIIQYVKKNYEKHPEDKRFSSISAFYTTVMEKAMKCFEKGKSLEDFEQFADGEMTGFYDQFSFDALKPLYEMITETNRYTELDYEDPLMFFLRGKELIEKFIRKRDLKQVGIFLKRAEIYFARNKIASKLNFEPLYIKKKEHPGIRVEAFCIYENICFENSKFFAGIFAMLGMKVVDFIHSKKNSYFRIDAIPTDLFFNNNSAKRERLKLLDYNMSLITNYKRVVHDKDFYLWMKMAKDNGVFLDFHNEFTKKKWIDLIQLDIKKSSPPDQFLISLLKFFERLHWINIVNEKDLIFKFTLPVPNYKTKKKILFNYLSKYSKIQKMDDNYLLG